MAWPVLLAAGAGWPQGGRTPRDSGSVTLNEDLQTVSGSSREPGRTRSRTAAVKTWLGAAALVLIACIPVLTLIAPQTLVRVVMNTPLREVLQLTLSSNPLCPTLEAWMGLRQARLVDNVSGRLTGKVRLVQRDEQGVELWETPQGKWWFPAGTEEKYVRFAAAQYELRAYPGLEIRKGDVVLDGGGFVGDWAHWALQAGAARVIIFEPAARQQECIRRNLAKPLAEGRAVLIPKGVWDKDEVLFLSYWEDNPAGDSVVVARSPKGEQIELTTIDRIVEELGLDRVDVIKLDVEGAETKAILGARKTLQRFQPRLAVATEHTADRLQKNRNVIEAVAGVAPAYRRRCGDCVTIAGKIVPETLYFDPH